MPTPACQQTMSVTVIGPFTMGPTVSPTATSSHHRVSAPRGPSAGVLRLDRVDLVVGVGTQLQRVVLLAGAGLRALGADHEPVLRRERGAVDLAEHLGHPFVDGTPGELARLLQHADKRVAPADLPVRPQGRPPLARAGRVERVHAAQGVALHEIPVLLGHLAHLVEPDERVAADQGWRVRSRRPSTSRPHRPRRTTVGCRRRRPRPRAGTHRRRGARSAARAPCAARECRCGRAAGRRPPR